MSLNYLSEPFSRESLRVLTVTDGALNAGLRSHVRKFASVPGSAVVSMNRDQCINVLMGEPWEALSIDPRFREAQAANARASVSGGGDAVAQAVEALRLAMDSRSPALDEEAVRVLAHDEAGKAMRNGAFPEDRVEEIVARMLADVKPAVASFEVRIGTAVNSVSGLRHMQFTQILTWLAAGVPLWLWGGAGAGKTTLARQLAAGLGVAAHVVSIDPTSTMGKLIGFRNLVTGEFVEGLLYAPYKNGGLVCLDEIDTGDAGILAGLNALLANGHYLFPNGETVEKHASFYVMAGANTKGTGAVGWYKARTQLDGATLDRFACVEMRYDEGLELALCCGIASESKEWAPVSNPESLCEKWVRWVQSVRATVGNSLLVSPRASLNGCRALRAGIPVSEVAEALVFKLASDDTKRAIVSRCGDPAALVSPSTLL